MLRKAKILITMPMRPGDPTEHTYRWATKAVQLAIDLGYDVKTIEKDDTTYDNVTKTIQEYKPDLFSHWGHGCVWSLQGNNQCVVTRKFTPSEIVQMIDSGGERLEIAKKILNPPHHLGRTSCPGICNLPDVCNPLCDHATNINLLKDSIVYAVACFSAAQLGVCSIKYGVKSYIGEDELLMFPVDSLNSQDMFGDVQITFMRELLLGHTVEEAEKVMSDLEDSLIRKYKKVKYISLPLLWNRIHRKMLGDNDAMIYR